MGTISNISAASNQQNQPVPLVPNPSPSSGMSFKDIFDAINPLQHIPVVSGMYRAATGNTISTASKLAGDAIYGIALGGGALAVASSIGSSVADTAVQEISGTSIGGHILNAASAITSPNSNTATPLVPSANPVAALASMEYSAQQASSAPTFLALDKNPVATSAQYQHAQILDTVNKKLVEMNS